MSNSEPFFFGISAVSKTPKKTACHLCKRKPTGQQNDAVLEPRGPNSLSCSTVSDNFQIIHNIHNQDLNNRESQFICNKITNDLDLCSPNPLHRNLLLAGDLNISSVAGRRFSYASPVPTVEANFSNSDRGTGSRMEKLLNDARLVEIEGSIPTRYCKATDSGATIDRIFTNLPQWIFPTSKWSYDILGDPKKCT